MIDLKGETQVRFVMRGTNTVRGITSNLKNLSNTNLKHATKQKRVDRYKIDLAWWFGKVDQIREWRESQGLHDITFGFYRAVEDAKEALELARIQLQAPTKEQIEKGLRDRTILKYIIEDYNLKI